MSLSQLRCLLCCLSLALMAPAYAVEPGELLPDAAMEARARQISAELRCLVCQNQSIDDSNAPLAKDLRVLVRERLISGESDHAVMAYVVARYGDFVLLKPPMNSKTLLLWLAPLLCLAGIAYAVLRATGRLGGTTVTPASVSLSADEERKLAELLKP
jgi:cytochrome c-type biogenesis protein CcmH